MAKRAPAKKAAKKRTPAPAKPPDLSHIAEDLKPLATPIGDLTLDPANARRHSARNLEAIAGSLRAFGQVNPIVALTDGTVIVGNGRLEAAKSLGWQHVAVVRFADVENARAFALADNRTAELADWDVELLETQLADLADLDLDVAAIGFDADEITALVSGETLGASGSAPGPSGGETKGTTSTDQTDQLPDGYRVLIDCDDETQQLDLLGRLTEEGLSCRALTA